MRCRRALGRIGAWLGCAAVAACGGEFRYMVDPGQVAHRIEEGIYGHFLEHIYHSCHGGLWGDVVWNRSFEDGPEDAWWKQGETIVQSSLEPDRRLTFGDRAWADYVFELEARKLDGEEGFLVLVRVQGPKQFYWANLGGWGNRYHQFEKCTPSRRRQGPVGPRRDVAIETGRWYRIRVTCVGTRIRADLDGQPWLDYEDTEPDAIRSGQVGIGTWETAAEFRNIQVRDLAGKILWLGCPEVPETPMVARHWHSLGPADGVQRREGDARNGRYFVSLVRNGAECGLGQSNLAVRARDVLRGSMWLRGQAPAGVCVRLVDSNRTILASWTSAPVAHAQWTEFTVTLDPGRTARSATIELTLAGDGQVHVDQFSLMPDSAKATGGFRPDLLGAVRALRPPFIRWPGGAYAERYRWKDGIGPQVDRRPIPHRMWDDLDVNSLGTDEFIALCRAVGAEPLLVINTGRHDRQRPRSDYLQEALDWVEYCNGPATSRWGSVRARHGHLEPYGVRLWELDNEAWIINDVELYLDIVREFAPALRRLDSNLVIIACGGAGYNLQSFRAWDPKLVAGAAELFDVLSIHHYENPDRFAAGFRRADRAFAEYRDLFRGSRNPRLRLFVSEWNAQSSDWRTGLYAGGLLNAMERHGDVVTMASPALFLRHVSAQAWDNALINFDAGGWFPAPNYVVMKLWRDHYAPEAVALEGPGEPLSVMATRSSNGDVILKLVNPEPEAHRAVFELRGPPIRSVRGWRVAPGALHERNTMAEPDRVRAEEVPVVASASNIQLEMPAYSVMVVRLVRRL